MSAAPQPESRSGQYEFTDEQNRTVSSLADAMFTVATLMKLLGLVFAIFCGFQLAGAVQTQAGYGPVVGLGAAALICLAIGFWTSGSARSFRRVVESRGEDVWHLMNALRRLHNMYSLLRTIILGSLVLAVVGLALALVGMLQQGG
jgi:hypothetical protein